MPSTQHPMLRLFRYIGPKSPLLWSGVFNSIANKIADLMPPLLVGWVIDSVRGEAPTWISASTGSNDPMTLAVFLSILAVLIFGAESVFQWAYKLNFMTLAQKVQHKLRLDTYGHLQKREIAFFENHRLGNTLAILNDDVNQLERFLNTGFLEILHLSVVVLFSGYIMLTTSWQLALVGLIPLPVIVWGSFYYKRIIAPKYAAVRDSAGELGSRLENNISGITVIKSFTAESFEFNRVKMASDAYVAANKQVISRNALYVPIIRMFIAIGFAGVLLVGSYWILNGANIITVGELVLFSMLIQRLLWPLTRLGETLDEFERGGASAKRIFDILDTPSNIQSPENPVKLNPVQGAIHLDQVSFHYREDIPILKDLSLKVAAGETIGIAGTTGSGKSTFVKLLLRLYDPVSGHVRLDDHDLRNLNLAQIRQSVALVSQDVYLFHGSIYDNIAYAIDGCNKDKVIEAAKLSELHDFVTQLPEGYNTIVGERGIKLSGGQRQRLSIARAILKNAPVMIFDEATSSVDTETERAIQQNIHQLTKGKTALIIAHRLSTIRHANRIIVINQGRICEEGSHDELVAKGGHYADLWQTQTNA